MPDPTTHYAWDPPNVGGDTGAWGTILNSLIDAVDKTIRAMAGKVSEQHLYLCTTGAGPSWVFANDGSPARVTAALSFPNSDGVFAIPLPDLHPGQRITGFTSRGKSFGAGTCTVKLCYIDANGARVEVAGASHSLPASEANTTTSGLTHDVATSRGYYTEFVPTNGTSGDGSNVYYVSLALSLL